jgi:hypothetical protein
MTELTLAMVGVQQLYNFGPLAKRSRQKAALVITLLNPPLAPSQRSESNALWREAGDAVQLLRMTGARFNELLRMELDQFQWSKGMVRLGAS